MTPRHGIYDDNTNDDCAAKCAADGYPYSGTQDRHLCYCNMYTPWPEFSIDDAACGTTCKGDESEMCGGLWKMSISYTQLDGEDMGITSFAMSLGSLVLFI